MQGCSVILDIQRGRPKGHKGPPAFSCAAQKCNVGEAHRGKLRTTHRLAPSARIDPRPPEVDRGEPIEGAVGVFGCIQSSPLRSATPKQRPPSERRSVVAGPSKPLCSCRFRRPTAMADLGTGAWFEGRRRRSRLGCEPRRCDGGLVCILIDVLGWSVRWDTQTQIGSRVRGARSIEVRLQTSALRAPFLAFGLL